MNNKTKHWKISAKWQQIIAAISLLVVVDGMIWTDSFLKLRHEHRKILEERQRANANLSYLLASHAERTISSAEQAIREVAEELDRGNHQFDVDELLRRNDKGGGLYLYWLMINDKGTVLRSKSGRWNGNDFRNHASFTNHKNNPSRELLISAPHVDQLTGKRIIDISIRLGDNDEFKGVAILCLGADYFEKMYKELTVSGKTSIALLLHANNVLVEVGSDFHAGQILNSTHNASIENFSSSHDDELLGFAHHTVPTFQQLTIVVGESKLSIADAYNHESRHHIQFALAVTGVIALFGMFAATYIWRVGTARKQRTIQYQGAIEKLTESTRRLEQVRRTANLGYWELDIVNNVLIWSEDLYDIFGVDKKSFTASYEAFLSLIHPDDKDMVGKAYSDSLVSRKPYSVEHRICMPDGTVKWIHENCTTHFDDDGSALRSIGTAQDITERKTLENALRTSEGQLRNIITNEPECIKVVNAQGDLIYMNPAGMAMLELDATMNIGASSLFNCIHPEHRTKYIELHRRVINGEAGQLEIEIVGLQGTHRWLHIHAVPLKEKGENLHLGIARDITEQKKVQKQLELAAATFESQEAMLITDKSQNILKVNQAFSTVTGYSAEEVIGKKISILKSDRHNSEYYEKIWSGIRREGGWRGEIWSVRKSGRAFPCWLAITEAKDSFGNVHHYIFSMFDVTSRKNSELKLLDLNTELLRSRKNLRQLAAANEAALEHERKHIAREVHDELGQVLTALRMDVSLLSMRFGKDNAGLDDQLNIMKELIERAISGVRNVASNLRPSALDMGLVPALEWLCSEFERRFTAKCSFMTSAENINIDEARAIVVFRIAQESLTNVSRHACAKTASVKLELLNEKLHLEIADDGIGFNVATIGGKSFGLLGMQERALALGGVINIDSSTQDGTRVSVLIPIKNDVPEGSI